MPRGFCSRLFLAVLVTGVVGAVTPSSAAILSYTAVLSGASEVPPNASPGTGSALVDIDNVLHTMTMSVVFSGLLGNTTASHIHAATAVAFTGTAGVATTTPTFAGFPLGVTSGTYNVVLNLLVASSYNPSYVTAHGGSPATAEVDLLQAIADGKAYLNIHSTQFGGGEIRGFLVPTTGTPATPGTWGRIKSSYR
jgi:hypothetical protein